MGDFLKIGCHLSSSGGYMAMAHEATSLGANTFAFFTRNPRGGAAKDIDPSDVSAFLSYSSEHGISPLVAHSPYTQNPCSANPDLRRFALKTMKDDLLRLEYTPGNYYNFHPGSHTGQGVETGIEEIAALLNAVLDEKQSTTVLLETMSGKGSEVGGRFEEIKEIISRVHIRNKIGVCLDTCHVWDAGYDIKDNLRGVLSDFDSLIGLNRLFAVHLNDSKNPLGAKKDRHETIGNGYIGFDALCRVINHPALRNLPFILETPNDEEGYKREISMLRASYEK